MNFVFPDLGANLSDSPSSCFAVSTGVSCPSHPRVPTYKLLLIFLPDHHLSDWAGVVGRLCVIAHQIMLHHIISYSISVLRPRIIIMPIETDTHTQPESPEFPHHPS